MLVLKGSQGIGKSTWFKSLLPNSDWFCDTFTPDRKELYMALQTSEQLPTPLPEYQLQRFELIWGNALWISIGVCVIAFSAEIINKKTKKI